MVTISITDINWKIHTIEVKADSNKSIVELAADEGIELPYSCMSGACFACCAEIKEWWGLIDKEKVGEQLIDVESDEVLCCIGWIKSDSFKWENKNIAIEMMN
jgi:ferredoxin